MRVFPAGGIVPAVDRVDGLQLLDPPRMDDFVRPIGVEASNRTSATSSSDSSATSIIRTVVPSHVGSDSWAKQARAKP